MVLTSSIVLINANHATLVVPLVPQRNAPNNAHLHVKIALDLQTTALLVQVMMS